MSELQDNINEKIDASNLSEKMKAKMRLVHEHFIKKGFFSPKYDLKGTKAISLMSFWALFFSSIYYLIKGLWRKAISLLLLGFVINICIIFIAETTGIRVPHALLNLGTYLIMGIAAGSAYYDIYRSKILNEKFWW